MPGKAIECFKQSSCVVFTGNYDSFSTVGNCKSALLASANVKEEGKLLLKLVLTILLNSASRNVR